MQKIYLGVNLFYDVYQKGERTIYAPSKELKDLQRQILNHIKTKYKVKFSIKDTAKVHCNKKWILKLDIRKFYESVSKEQIKQVISDCYKDMEILLNLNIADDMYHIATVNDKLPTGAATSSYIANIAFENTQIDYKLMVFCKSAGLNYSRYMDDMFFSGDNKNELKKAEKYATKLLKESGFNINHEKTQYISNNRRQEILGLVVNNQENCVIPCDKKHDYRSMFFNYLRAVSLEERLGITSLFKKRVGYKEITGHLAYIKNSDTKFYETMKKYIKSKINKFGIYNNDEIKKLRKVINKG